jgi:two-component sensor histidine kinase/CheY-like chemotaxis protein
MGSWEFDPATDHLEWDTGQHRIYAIAPEIRHPTRQQILEIVHPEDRAKHPLMGALNVAGDRYQAEFRIVRPDGELRWCHGSAVITRDAEGNVVRLNGVSVDMTDRKRAEERQLLLAREVDHRAKNMLAVVLSVLRLTKAKSMPDFVTTVEGRIHALAATHNLLSATHWEGADLRRIVEDEMAPYRTSGHDRIVAEGPAAMLLPATAQAVALALHELATNAAKYGALSVDTGRLRLTWSVGKEALVLEWLETGGPPAAPPSSLGFGLSIVRSSIEAQFRGGVIYDWRPEGLCCRLSIPSAQIVGPEPAPPAAKPAAADPTDGRPRSLAGKHLLMVEDEFLVGMMAKTILEGLGARVSGPHARLADGIAAARSERFDGALLDFNLAGELAEPLADLLIARGVPFVFLTGYQRDSIDRRYANVPLLQKPVEADALEQVLGSLLAPRPMLQVAQRV